MPVQKVGIGGILEKRGFGREAFHRRVARHAAPVLPARKVPEAIPHRPEARHQILARPAAQVGDVADPGLVERALPRLADAPDQAHGLVSKEIHRLGPPDHREAARLVEVGGDLGQELVVRQAHRPGDSQLCLHALDQLGQHRGRRAAMQPGGARKVEERLVQRQGFDGRGHFLHHRPDLARNGGVDLHPAAHHHRLGAQLQRLEHRHRRAHPLDARDVAGGGHHAAPPAADDDRLVAQVRVVAFLDAGIEGVAIHVRDGEVEQLRVRRDARPPAGGAAGAGLEGRQAVAAEGGHGVRACAERGRSLKSRYRI